MHDCKGRPLQTGDTILVPFKITQTVVTEGGGYCNVSAETVASMYPAKYKTGGTFNAKQVIRANDGDDTSFVVRESDGAASIE
jgi:hypothetical protein